MGLSFYVVAADSVCVIVRDTGVDMKQQKTTKALRRQRGAGVCQGKLRYDWFLTTP